jgi:hypothetical protein
MTTPATASMMQQLDIRKGLIYLALLGGAAFWAAHKIRRAIARTAPVGYEDEQGFHFGDAPFNE